MADSDGRESTESKAKASSIVAVAVARDGFHPVLVSVWPVQWSDATLPLR